VIVLDTSLLVAWTHRRDVHHPAAAQFMVEFAQGALGKGLLLEYVFQEFVTVVQRRIDHATAVRVARHLRRAKDLEFIPSAGYFDAALEVFEHQEHQGLSLVDSMIVAAARHRSQGRIASFDRGFDGVEGVTRLP